MDVKHLYVYGLTIYQFTAIDYATRRLHTKCFTKINSLSGKKFLLELLWKGQYLGTDNGSEFLGKCNEYCEEAGIKHVFSTPRSPKQNPLKESLEQSLMKSIILQELKTSMKLQQAKLATYEEIYNTIRPHQTLKYLTPNEQYAKLIQAEVSS